MVKNTTIEDYVPNNPVPSNYLALLVRAVLVRDRDRDPSNLLLVGCTVNLLLVGCTVNLLLVGCTVTGHASAEQVNVHRCQFK